MDKKIKNQKRIDNMKEEWYTGDKLPKLGSTILIELKGLCFTKTSYGAGYFYAPEPELEDDLYYHLRMCNGEYIEFENKEKFTSIVKRWRYLE